MKIDIKQYCFSFIVYLQSLPQKKPHDLVNHLAIIEKCQIRRIPLTPLLKLKKKNIKNK
jgi:hypothetical protein